MTSRRLWSDENMSRMENLARKLMRNFQLVDEEGDGNCVVQKGGLFLGLLKFLVLLPWCQFSNLSKLTQINNSNMNNLAESVLFAAIRSNHDG